MWPAGSSPSYTRLRSSYSRLPAFYLRKSLYLLALSTLLYCAYTVLVPARYLPTADSIRPTLVTASPPQDLAIATDLKTSTPDDAQLFNSESPALPDHLIRTSTCLIRRVPLFTEETRKLYRKFESAEYFCNKSSVEDRIVRLNYTWVQVPSELAGQCSAREVIRSMFNEDSTYGRSWERIGLLTEFPDSDAILVQCGDAQKLLPLVPAKKPFHWDGVPVHPRPQPPTRPINVLLLGIDAVSRLNLLRHFPRTTRFLDSHNFTSLLGHHKVGDNTLPNLFAMFLGQPKSTWWAKLPASHKLDGLPFIFKRYSNAGYLTTYIEDYPYCGLFTFHGVKGFADQPPTEYYLRPVNLWLRRKGLYDHTWCYGNKLEMEHYYEYTHDQLSAFRNRSQPHLTWIHQSTVSHEELNNCQYVDGPLSRLLEGLFAEQLNASTVIILYSDHAIRIGPILETESGFHETRLPFLYVYVPEGIKLQDANGNWLESAQMRSVLQSNAHRLTSHMDVHATLRHILDGVPPSDEPFGRSLFVPVPENRTCEQAGVPSEYCLCNRFVNMAKTGAAEAIARLLVEQFNEQLAAYSECVQLQFDSIVSAKIALDGAVPSKKKPKEKHKRRTPSLISLVFTVAPSGAKFDATVSTVLVGEEEAEASVDLSATRSVGKIARNDRYAEQSTCVAGSSVETLCYCRELHQGASAVSGTTRSPVP